MDLVNQNASCALTFQVRNAYGYQQSVLVMVKRID